MCGLIGLVTSDRQATIPCDPRLLVEQTFAPDLAKLDVLETQVGGLEKGLEDLFTFSSIYSLMEEPDRLTALREICRRLGNLVSRCDSAHAQATRPETQERYGAVATRVRDMAWHLEEDLLPNLRKVRKLAGIEGIRSRNHAFQLWKINTLLNGIDRLEVRGRDSAGLALQLYFSSTNALDELLIAQEAHSELESREALQDFVSRAIRRIDGCFDGWSALSFSYKVAREIGQMGENVAALRESVSSDPLLHAALAIDCVKVGPLAHTRWASNGVISEPNCHPLDNEVLSDELTFRPGNGQQIIAALNGDIDNYQELKEQLRREKGRSVASSVTTDAKIIPLWIDRYLELGHSFEESFRRAVNDFDGSVAIAVQSTREPGRLYLAQRGSGQSIYIGVTPTGYLCASELYGLVEETSQFIKMDGEGERIPGDPSTAGQIAIADVGWTEQSKPSLRLRCCDGTEIHDVEGKIKRAEITTRDINRAGYPHFMLKEITESVGSVKKTIRGKYRLDGPRVEFNYLDDVLTADVRERLRNGQIRRVNCIGQGTASIAAQGIVAPMSRLLADTPLDVVALKATELSGFHLRESMDDTLVVAVSQSGTTTDTNRTVDMVRQRGAYVIGLVNRRNSDLVYKADAVLYTSDGRDVEMSVASTKAFYAQVVAGYLLTLSLAQIFEVLDDGQLRSELERLEQLPSLIGRVLQNSETIRALAEKHAVEHRHWAVVGNGANKVAAEETRIKLSELCYKAIACDHTEDKKHIDLSSEPLILVCAAGLSSSNLNDVVKEVAIFSAHKARPLVITTEGERRFDPYAAGVIHVPEGGGRLAFVLSTVAGHLWGYYAARALDEQAQLLRKLRAHSVAIFEELRNKPGGTAHDTITMTIRARLANEIRKCECWLAAGALNSGLTAAVAVRLTLMLHAITGRLGFDEIVLELDERPAEGRPELVQSYLAALTDAINALTRPIDAIKHQAKTVTVGISRASTPIGVIFEKLGAIGVSVRNILPSHVETLQALTPLIETVTGSVQYQLKGLNEAGDPEEGTLIRVVTKTGIVADVPSRADHGASLMGTKWLISLERRAFVGVGSSDRKPLVMFPLVDKGALNGILLLHVRFNENAGLNERITAVRHYRNRYERLVGMTTERNLSWSDDLLLRIPVKLLFEGSSEKVVAAVRQ